MRGECEIISRSFPRPKIGAKDRTDKNTSFRMISGVASNDDTVWDVVDGVDATVWRISPIFREEGCLFLTSR